MEGENNEYWLARRGEDYEQQQLFRRADGLATYVQQEEWLTAYFGARSRRLGRPLRVLEFGCGFGRFAHLFHASADVTYFGYDFSEAMAAPLFEAPPRGLGDDVRARIRIAPTVGEAFGDEHFDVVFTVSVLIHNSPGLATSLVAAMQMHLTPQGELCFIENELCAVSAKANNWHGGCWFHCMIDVVPKSMDLTIHLDAIDTHSIYLATNSVCEQRKIVLATASGHHEVSEDSARARGINTVYALLDSRPAESSAALEGALHDARERLTSLERAVRVRSEVRRTLAKLGPATTWLDKKLDGPHHRTPNTPPLERFEWMADRDVKFANTDARFDRVCHVFHQEWFGIRAAAGALPGKKLALSADRPIESASIGRMIALLDEHYIAKIIVHGMSDSMYAFCHAVRASTRIETYIVSHGTPAMWVAENERRFSELSLRLVRDGVARRYACVRRGMEGLLRPHETYVPQLLNAPPVFPKSRLPRVRRNREATAISVSWNLIHKNVTTNVLAAQTSERIREVRVVAGDLSLPDWLSTKITRVPQMPPHDVHTVLGGADIVLNATLIDCHPMVDLEALAIGTPSIRSALFLDALEDHPYARAVTVANPLSVADVRARIDHVLAIESTELDAMMADYDLQLRKTSKERYAGFVEL